MYGNNCGYLLEKLRNKAKKQNQSNDENDNEQSDPRAATNTDELMQFFKNCLVEQQMDELKAKMAEFVDFRRQILANPPEPICKIFSFYFVDPDLVNMIPFLISYSFTIDELIFPVFSFRFYMTSNCCLTVLMQML